MWMVREFALQLGKTPDLKDGSCNNIISTLPLSRSCRNFWGYSKTIRKVDNL